MRDYPQITVGIPIYNEEEILQELIKRVIDVLSNIPGGSHELLIVDDGSSDLSLDILKQAVNKNPCIIVIRLSRNFGHQAAISAALMHASNEVIILMDGDLQDPPEAIPKFIDKYRKGFDVVYANRASRKENLLLKSCYYLFYRIIRSLSSVTLPVDSGDFSLLSRKVVTAINSSSEYHRYIRGLRAWAGFRQIGISIDRPARYKGTSKYNFFALLGLAFDGIFSFSIIPLRIATFFGIVTVFFSVLFACYSLYVKFMLNQSPVGFTAIILAIIFTSGVQMIFMGIIGEYLGRIYNETKRRPNYVINNIIKRSR